MAIRLTEPDPRIDAIRGCLALERGPLVYCLETVDLPPGTELEDLRLDPSVQATKEPRPDIERSMIGVRAAGIRTTDVARQWPYADAALIAAPAPTGGPTSKEPTSGRPRAHAPTAGSRLETVGRPRPQTGVADRRLHPVTSSRRVLYPPRAPTGAADPRGTRVQPGIAPVRRGFSEDHRTT